MKNKQKISIGDRVQLNEHHEIKSKVVDIRPGTFNNVDIYYLRNGCQAQLNEITKMKS